MIKDIVNIYKYLILKIYNQNITNISSKSFNLFIESFRDNINKEFIWDYICFQMEYWSNKKTNNNFHLSWVFGEKAINRWKNRLPSWNYYTQLFLNKLEIERPIIYYSSNLFEQFEVERSKFFGTEEGLVNCITNSYYLETSKYCMKCEFNEICKKI